MIPSSVELGVRRALETSPDTVRDSMASMAAGCFGKTSTFINVVDIVISAI